MSNERVTLEDTKYHEMSTDSLKPVNAPTPVFDSRSNAAKVSINNDSSSESLKPGKSNSPLSQKSGMKEQAIEELKASTSSLNTSLKEKASTMTQFVVDSQFLNTMRFDFKKEYSKIPEHGIFQLLLGKEVEQLKRELAFLGPKELFKRDKEFRSPLHLAVAANTSATPLVIDTLFGCFFSLSAARFASDISLLEYEKHNCISTAMSVTSAQTTVVKSNRQTNVKGPIGYWFAQECKRVYTQALIRNEWFWAQMLMMEDLEARTALHYAVASRCSIDTLKSLVYATVKGRSQLHAVYPKCANWDSTIFQPNVMYDSLTGHAIVATLEGRFGSSQVHASIDTLSSPAGKQKSRTVQSVDFDLDGLSLTLDSDTKSDADELVFTSRRSGSRRNKEVVLDYDTIVPWLLTNIDSQCKSKGAKFELSGAEMLEEVIRDYNSSLEDLVEGSRRRGKRESSHRSRSSRSSHGEERLCLLPCEFVVILEMFGIRVVEEVVREVCRRYFAEKDYIDDRVAFVNKHRKLVNKKLKREDRRRDRELSRRADSDSKDDAKQSKGSAAAADSYSEESMSSGESSSDDEISYRAHSKNARAGSAGDKGSGSDRRARTQPSKRSVKVTLLDPEEEVFGIDTARLLRDFKTGQAFVKIPVSIGASKERSGELSGRLSALTRRNNVSDEAFASSQAVGDAILKTVLSHHGTTGTTRHMNASTSGQKQSKEVDGTRIRYCAFPASISKSLLDSLAYQVLNAQDSYDRTVLMLASALGYKEHVSALLDRCYDVSSVHSIEGKAQAGGSESGTVVDLAIMTSHGHTAISLASKQSISSMLQQRLVGWLTENKRDVSGVHSGSVDTSLASDKTKALKQLAPQLERLQKSNWQYSRVPLAWAVLNGLPEAVEHMLAPNGGTSNSSTLANETDALGRTPLHECMVLVSPSSESNIHSSNALQIAEMLYTAGADLDARSISGKTPLHELFSGQSSTARSAIEGVNSDKDAIAEERRGLLKALLQWGANPTLLDFHGSSGGWAPVHYCARSNAYCHCMLEFLRSSVVDTTSTTPILYTSTKLLQNCLHVACLSGCDKMAHILVRWDIESEIIFRINQPNGSPGSFSDNYDVLPVGRGIAKKNGESKAIYSLMSSRDINNKLAKNLMNHTMNTKALDTLWLACYMGNPIKVADMLREYKLNSGRAGSAYGTDFWLETSIDCKSPHLKLTPMHCAVIGWAVYEAYNCNNGPAQQCLRVNVSPAGKSSGGSRRAVTVGNGNGNGKHAEVLQLLLKSYAYADAVDKHGRTPLMIASAANLHVAINMLLRNRASIAATEVRNARSRNHASSGDPAADDDYFDGDELDDVASSINITDVEGNCSLHYAYATGAAAAITALEAALINSSKRVGEVLNFKQESPMDSAGKISYMRPILPRVCNFYLKVPVKPRREGSNEDGSRRGGVSDYVDRQRTEDPSPAVTTSKIDLDDL